MLRLLDRGRGGLSLTPAGEVLLEHADYVAWRLQLAETQISDLARNQRAQVRLGAFPTALTGFVPAAVERLRSSQSDVEMLLSEVTAGTLEQRLLGGEVDLAIAYQESQDERRELEGAERIDLLQETFLVGMAPSHRLAGEVGPVSLAAFAEDDWILPSETGFLADACREAGFEPKVLSITQDPIATRGLISRGLAVGWVPSLLARDFADAVTRPIDGPMRRRDVYALVPPGHRHPLATEIVDALRATATEFGPGG